MKLIKISTGLYQISITFANAVYSIISDDDNWCKDAFDLLDSLKSGTYA